MAFKHFKIFLLFLSLLYVEKSYGKDSLLVHMDFMYWSHNKFIQEVYLVSQLSGDGEVKVECYYFKKPDDSILVYKIKAKDQQVRKGVTKIKLNYSGKGGAQFVQPAFAKILRKTGLNPPGLYKTYVSIYGKGIQYNKAFLQEKDSILGVNSILRNDLLRLITPVMKKTGSVGTGIDKASNALLISEKRLNRYLHKQGLTSTRSQREGKEIIKVYSDSWFLGQYELASNASVSEALAREQNQIKNNIGSFTETGLSSYSSLLSQFQELKKNSKEDKELIGEVGVSGNFSSGQEEYSALDNNYYELRGSLEFPVFDIPFTFNGYYTTQDQHREAKSSYFHIKYDANKAKEQLMGLISGYKQQYQQTVNRGSGYEMIYGQYISRLKAEQADALSSLKQTTGLPDYNRDKFDEAYIQEQITEKLLKGKEQIEDSLNNLNNSSDEVKLLNNKRAQIKAAQEKAEAQYEKAMEAYKRLQEIEEKLSRYEMLLAQYKNTSYFDSLLVYDKIKDIDNIEDLSYKDLSKKASHLLPEGKAKSAISGLVGLEAGIFPNYISSYTMSGQMMKGLDAAYDIGLGIIGGSYGTTEFIDREGNVESYKTYSGRVASKPFYGQQLGFVYYGYSPSRKLLTEQDFFKSIDISIPGFRNPVNIISTTYKGEISKYLTLAGEYALTQKQGQNKEAAEKVSEKDKSAYNITMTGNIPFTAVNLEAGYEFAGTAFENNTLPVLMSGTEKLRIAGKGDFFRSFLTLGVEYNYLLQNSFYGEGRNSRWGFDIATHSKRYPSVSIGYKPFSSFRSYNDTLNIEQKPIIGEVWTGRVMYQIKKQDKAVRISLLYNKNNSITDTIAYGSSSFQMSTIYTQKTTMMGVNIGSTKIQTDMETAYPALNDNLFVNVMIGGDAGKNVTLNGGVDVAGAEIGLTRYGFNIGSNYRLNKIPMMFRANFRYSNYRLDSLMDWKALYAGGIELIWRFKTKI